MGLHAGFKGLNAGFMSLHAGFKGLNAGFMSLHAGFKGLTAGFEGQMQVSWVYMQVSKV